MRKIKRVGLWLMIRVTREKIHIWRGLIIVLDKVRAPDSLVVDIGRHIAGLQADVRSMEQRWIWWDVD